MWVLAAVVVVALLVWSALTFAGWPRQPGDDWLWYRDGIDRLAGGLPIYRPEWLNGPYDFVSRANYYGFNQVPWLLPFVAPFAALPEPLARFAWLVAMDLALGIAIAMSVGPKPLDRLPALIALLLWAPTLMGLVWGNVENLVVLGVVIWLIGVRRGSTTLLTFGIVLASLKVVPAFPLILLTLRFRGGAPVFAAAIVVLILTAPAVLLQGIDVLPHFVVIASNIIQWPALNLSPSIWAGIPLGVVRAAAVVVMLMVLRIRRDWLALAGGQLAACALVSNLYADWLLIVVLPVIGYRSAGERPGDADLAEQPATGHA